MVMAESVILGGVKATAEAVDQLMGFASALAANVRDCGHSERAGLDIELIEAAAQCRSLMVAILDRVECTDPCDSMGNASRIMMPGFPVDVEKMDQTSSMEDFYRGSTTISSVSAQSPEIPYDMFGTVQVQVAPGPALEPLP